ncbi:glycosyltransferase family 4 protein [Thermoanaerobacterium sp. DL9XJH110]|uniref:glycosyltransferase family 4 protein n=1 Tax=Thermoanaerobacterium sp. DL9XJH110 TaxID=3386643 RepID=UPI003BB72675
MAAKKIWIFNHYAITPDMSGGTRHYDLAKELVKYGYDVTIFASGFDHMTKRYVRIIPEDKFRVENYNGVQFVWVKTTPYYGNDLNRIKNMFSYALNVIRIARKFEKPDIIIGSSMHPFAVIAAWWLSKKFGSRFFFEVRDLWPQTAVDMNALKPSSPIVRLLYVWEKFMYKKAEKIITLLPNAADYITKKGISKDKIVWIPNGVDLSRYEDLNNENMDMEILKIFDEYKDKFKVVYTGAHGPANGLDMVIDAAKLMEEKDDSIQFLLIGDGPEKQNLIDKAKTFSLSNICFLDPVPKLYMPHVLKKADLLLHCLKPMDVFKHGISPNKMFDYLASGKPIIMSVNASNNIVDEARAGISVKSGDPEELVNGILKLKNMSEDERRAMGLNGYEYVKKYFSTAVLAQKMIKELNL